ncbi:MAG: CopG family transcriptional regulator [Acidilobaceae archaeon]
MSMSVVFSIRIPRKLKEEMEELKDLIDWRSEIIAFIEERVRMYKRMKALQEITRMLEELPETPRGMAGRIVREDRDYH